MDFKNFKEKITNTLENWPDAVAPKLFHLHFTLEYNLKEVEILNVIIPIHTIFLPPNIYQYQTVYKSANIEHIFHVAQEFFKRANEIKLIGAKLEVLVNTKQLLANLECLPPFNYIECHFEYDDTTSPLDVGIVRQYFSYSFKKGKIVNAVRFFDDKTNRSQIKRNLESYYSICDQPFGFLIEISIYDAWHTNIEKEWIELSERVSEEEIVKCLKSNFKSIQFFNFLMNEKI